MVFRCSPPGLGDGSGRTGAPYLEAVRKSGVKTLLTAVRPVTGCGRRPTRPFWERHWKLKSFIPPPGLKP